MLKLGCEIITVYRDSYRGLGKYILCMYVCIVYTVDLQSGRLLTDIASIGFS